MSHIEIAARSDIGRLRERNEDVIGVDLDRAWAILADGMGGYRGGDIAARIGVDALERSLAATYRPDWCADDASNALKNAVRAANAEIYRAGQQDAELALMGSTVVAAIFVASDVIVAHVGDSRLYRLRDGVLRQLTRDHTVLQDRMDEGLLSADEARLSGAKGMLTRGLGVTSRVEIDIATHEVRIGDLFLLCSDGLTDMLSDRQIADLMMSDASLEQIADELVDAANRHGGRDNVSIVLARMIV